MPWITTPPWQPGSQRLPCIALGKNQEISGGQPRPPQTTRNNTGSLDPFIPGGRQQEPREGLLNLSVCVNPTDVTLLDVTLEFIPGEDELDKRFRLFEDSLLVNSNPARLVPNQSYPFELTSGESNTFRFSIYAAEVVNNWFSVADIKVIANLCYDGEHTNRQQIRYTSEVNFRKGPIPPPASLKIENGTAIISFQGVPGSNCSCFSDCIPSSGIAVICPDKKVDIIRPIFANPDTCIEFTFTIVDASGNTYIFIVPVIEGIIPMRPSVVLQSSSVREISIGLPLASRNFSNIEKCISHYQVEKYIGSESNREILVDWHKLPKTIIGNVESSYGNTITDRKIISGLAHGYRVRYKGTYGDFSQWSDWTKITPTHMSENNNIDDEVDF